MATITIYASADGMIQSSATGYGTQTYAQVRAGVNLVASSPASFRVGQAGSTDFSAPFLDEDDVSEGFLSFDTSTVSTPVAVILSLYTATGTLDNGPFIVEARLHDWGATLDTADWVPGASLSTKTLLASYDRSVNYSPGMHVNFTESGSAFSANLNLAGFTRILLSSDQARLGNPTAHGANGTGQYLYFSSISTTGTTQDPKIVVNQGPAQRLAPDGLTVQTNLTGTLANIQDDPDLPDTGWLTATTSTADVTAHVTFPTPAGGLLPGAGLQEFRVRLRRGLFAGQPSGATVTISLYENGSLISSGTPTVLTIPTGEVLSYTWDATGRNAALIECRVVAVHYQSGPDKGSADIGAIEWIAAAAIQVPSIPTAESVPSPIVQFTPQTITIASGIATAASVPNPNVVPVISPPSIPSAASVPSVTIVGGAFTQTVSPTSITTAQSVPSPQLNLTIYPTSIPTAQSVPAPSVGQQITILAGIPSAASVPAPSFGQVIKPTSIASRENFPAPHVGPPVALTDWELKVFKRDGTLVAYVPRWNGLQFQKLLNAEGTGSVTIDLDDDVFLNIGSNDLLNNEFIWEVWWNAKRVFGFSNEDIAQVHIASDGSRTATMSGRGLGKFMEGGVVLPPGFPAGWPSVIPQWELVNVSAMGAWLQLLAAAQERGAITSPTLTPTFSATVDSGSGTWTDVNDLTIAPGDNLLSTFTKMVDLARGPVQPDGTYAIADWIVQPDRTIEVRAPFGNHYESLVRFQVGYDQVAFSRARTRKDIRNAMYVESADGDIADDVRSLSQTAWGRRELYVKATDAPDFAAGLIYASRALDVVKDEKVQITITVLPDGEGRVVFFDYDVGDWVGVNSDDARVTGDYRIVSISVAVDDSGGTVLQLGMQSLMQYQLDRLAKAISTGGGAGSLTAAATGIGNNSPTPAQIVESATRGPIIVTPTGLSLSTGANLNVVYIDAGWTGPAAGFTNPDPITEYEVEVNRTLPLPAAGTNRLIRVKAGTPAAGSPDAAVVRIEPVEPNSTYQVRVRAISRLGQSSALTSSATIATLSDTTPPVAAPAGLTGGAGLRSVTITWTEVVDIDVKNGNGTYDVQLDTSTAFNTGNLRGVRTSGTVASFTDLTPTGTTWYARVRAVDSGGMAGPWSAASAGMTTAATAATDIGANSITTGSIAVGTLNGDRISAATLVGTQIIAGSVTGDRITANSLSAQAIMASNLSVAVDLAVGGVLRTDYAFGPTDHRYIIMDGGGLRFYSGGSAAYIGGVPTMLLDTATGLGTFNNVTVNGTINAVGGSFSGNITSSAIISGGTLVGGLIKTSGGGARLELDAAGLRAYPVGVNEVQTVTITGAPTGGTFTLTCRGQTTGAIPYNASAASVQAFLDNMAVVGVGNVTGTGGPLPANPVSITFVNNLGSQDIAQMTATASFTGGTTPAVTVTTPTQGSATAVTTISSTTGAFTSTSATITGTITATTLTTTGTGTIGGTLTVTGTLTMNGGTIRTAAIGSARIEMSSGYSNEMKFLSAAGTQDASISAPAGGRALLLSAGNAWITVGSGLGDNDIQFECWVGKYSFLGGTSYSEITSIDSVGNAVHAGNLYCNTVYSHGGGGIQFDWYGGGWYMQDSTWIRAVGNKNVYTPGVVRGDNCVATVVGGVIRCSGEADPAGSIFYNTGTTAPANGNQSHDGPTMRGWASCSLGSATNRFNNIMLRTWDNGGDFRVDVYGPLYALQGLNTSGGKVFQIDHPVLGPNHHLTYSAIEGPRADLIWRGKVLLRKGAAEVHIDEEANQTDGTFEALTMPDDRQFFLYNTTGNANPLGSLNGAILTITCADQNATIGWMLVATRGDPSIVASQMTDDEGRLIVETPKTAMELSTTQQANVDRGAYARQLLAADEAELATLSDAPVYEQLLVKESVTTRNGTVFPAEYQTLETEESKKRRARVEELRGGIAAKLDLIANHEAHQTQMQYRKAHWQANRAERAARRSSRRNKP